MQRSLREVRRIVEKYLDGATVVREGGKGHYKVRDKDGQIVTVCSTHPHPTDRKNFEAKIKRHARGMT